MRRAAVVAALLIVAVGIAVRVPAIVEPHSSYHGARQYRSAIIARDLTYELWGDPGARTAAHADRAARELGVIEAPVVEGLAAVLRTGEPGDLWRIRALGGAAHLSGIAFLAWRLRRRLGDTPALVGLGAGVLLPFGFTASVSFQPEPFIVGLLCAALGLLVGAGEDDGLRSRTSLVVGGLTGVAGLLKVTAIPVVLVPYLWVHRHRLRDRAVAAGAALAVVPVAAWLLAGVVLDDFLEGQTGGRVLPGLLDTRAYWTGWRTQLDRVAGLWLVAASLAGALAAARPLRGVLAGAWFGYALVGVTFTYHISTHDYYSLVVVPMLVAGVAAGVAEVLRRLPERRGIVAAAAVALGALLVADGWSLVDRHRAGELERAADVAARHVEPGDPVVVFGLDGAAGFGYLTRTVALPWTTAADVRLARLSGRDVLVGEELLARYRAEGRADWFVVTAPDALPLVPSLVEVLDRRPVVACDPAVIVVDLDRRAGGAPTTACLAELGIAG